MNSGIPAPPVLVSNISPGLLLAIWAALTLIVSGMLMRDAIVKRDVMPVALIFGALFCALNEAIYDVLGKLVYTTSPQSLVAYEALGRNIPWFVVILYVPWVGFVSYRIGEAIVAGASRWTLRKVAFGLFLSVLVAEVANALWLHAWCYYSEVPIRGVLAGGLVQMTWEPIICGLLLAIFARGASRWRRGLLGLIVPAMSLPIAFASTTWPLYFSNYSNLPAALDWLAALLTVLLNVLAVFGVTNLAERMFGPTQDVDRYVASATQPEVPAGAAS